MPIASMADKIAGVLTSTYLVAVVLALGIRFLFWGADLSILWRRYMFNPTFKKQWICEDC